MAETVTPRIAGSGFYDEGWLSTFAQGFDSGVNDLNAALQSNLDKLMQDPSNPSLLAAYQSTLSAYTLYRNAQSNTTKVFKDVDSAIIQNFR